MSSEKLSLPAAIFINLNIMISTGLFVNTVILSQRAGAAGFLLYPLVGIFMLPLIAGIAKLLDLYPSGGFYSFAKAGLGEPFAFLSTWSYFIGKLASCSLMLFVSSRFLQQLIPAIRSLETLSIALTILAIFTILNLLKVTIGVSIQSFFLLAKCIPIFFIVFSGIYFFDMQALDYTHFLFTGIPTSIPLVLYSLAGFEASCSLSRSIENARINAPKAIYYSFFFALFISCLFQFLVFMGIHEAVAILENYTQAFPYIVEHLQFTHGLSVVINNLLSFAIGISALGGAYGILFSNSWNIFELAHNNHLFLSSWIRAKNRYFIPAGCIVIESALCAIYLLITLGNQLPLQQTASLGVTLSYTICMLILLSILISQKANLHTLLIPIFGLGTCFLFIAACLQGFIHNGIASIYLFAVILGIGMMMYTVKTFMKRLQPHI